MKTIASALVLILIQLIPVSAQDGTLALDLATQDVQYVEIELRSETLPKLRIYFSRSALERVQPIVSSNLEKTFTIRMNGNVVAKPMLKEPFQSKTKFLRLTFPDFASAARAAQILVPNP